MNQIASYGELLIRQMARDGHAMPMRERVHSFESLMREMPQLKLAVFHHFSPGIYCRELHIPAGVITTGKIHKFSCMNIMAQGERSTLVGDQVVRVKAPFIHVSAPGTKRISLTHEDSIWITVHPNPTEERDIDKLEQMLVAETEDEYQAFEAEQRRCLS